MLIQGERKEARIVRTEVARVVEGNISFQYKVKSKPIPTHNWAQQHKAYVGVKA